ncbi:MAG: hypothetical protein R2861_06360 [Desulfobacterales bacterium]
MHWDGSCPPVKDHDAIARGIVEKGLKRGRHLVVIPWQIYLGMIMRGIVPDFILAGSLCWSDWAIVLRTIRAERDTVTAHLKTIKALFSCTAP